MGGGNFLVVLSYAYEMLAIIIKDDFPGKIALPIDLNKHVIVPRFKLYLHSCVVVAIKYVVDVLAELFGALFDFEYNKPDWRVLIFGSDEFSMILLDEGQIALCSDFGI